MMVLSPFPTISEAWKGALAAAASGVGGRQLHLVISVDAPAAPDLAAVSINDAALIGAHNSVNTVASTIFPSGMYSHPDVEYVTGMESQDLKQLDSAAESLFATYRQMLPMLQSFDGNRSGTYFGRMVSWPGKGDGGYNQLAVRIRQLRKQRDAHRKFANAADLAIEGTAEIAVLEGLQIYKSDDERERAFPCLVHIDISVVDNKLSLLAVYRHWHMITKAHGNLIGLSRLQNFLVQQSGFDVGELVVHGTVANAQFDAFGGAKGVRNLVAQLAESDGKAA